MSIDKNPDEWITEFEIIRDQIDDTNFSSLMAEFFIHILINLSKKYCTFLDSLQSKLLKSDPDELMIEDTQDKLRDNF